MWVLIRYVCTRTYGIAAPLSLTCLHISMQTPQCYLVELPLDNRVGPVESHTDSCSAQAVIFILCCPFQKSAKYDANWLGA